MKHSFIDEYSGLDSLIHGLDPRTKLIGSLCFILAVVLTPVGNWPVFGFYFVVMSLMVIFSRLPLLHVARRSLAIIPFVLMIALFIPFFRQGHEIAGFNVGYWHIAVSYEGMQMLLTVVVKGWLSILCLIVLTSSTKLADTLEGMRRLGVPGIFILIISFMYRYIFVLADQVMRMKQARDSRNFGGRRLHQLKTIGNMIGILFIRTYERGERVYAAMLSRGYIGEMPVPDRFHLRAVDVYFSVVLITLLACPAILWW
jgi:cobalt/nickel transport system permease protein